MNGAGGAIYQNGYGGTLINATISNTYANGNGGAIYWKGSTPGTITNISITYSQTEVFNSTNSADGGAIYLDSSSAHLTLRNNIFISNTAGEGQSVYNCGVFDSISDIYRKKRNPSRQHFNGLQWKIQDIGWIPLAVCLVQ